MTLRYVCLAANLTLLFPYIRFDFHHRWSRQWKKIYILPTERHFIQLTSVSYCLTCCTLNLHHYHLHQPETVAKLRLGEFTPRYITDQNSKLPLRIPFSKKKQKNPPKIVVLLPFVVLARSRTLVHTYINTATHLWHSQSLTFYPQHEHNIHTNTDPFGCINPSLSFRYFCAYQHGGRPAWACVCVCV